MSGEMPQTNSMVRDVSKRSPIIETTRSQNLFMTELDFRNCLHLQKNGNHEALEVFDD
jgi:hypothetical protein